MWLAALCTLVFIHHLKEDRKAKAKRIAQLEQQLRDYQLSNLRLKIKLQNAKRSARALPAPRVVDEVLAEEMSA